jgi:hypothetical protein
MDDFITVYYWIRLGALVAVTLISLVVAIRMSTTRTYRPWREILIAVLAVLLFAALAGIVGVTFGPLWGGVLALVGLAVGYFANRGVRVSSEGERTRVRSSPVGAWVWFAAVILTMAALLFAESYTFALSMLLLAFAVGVVIGQTVALLMGAKESPASLPAPEASAA